MQFMDIPEQTPSLELDEEILEVFIEEVEEIIQYIVTEFNSWKNEPANSEAVTNLLRSFHTLRGSGGLVGATEIGELGGQFEKLLNQIIDGKLSINNDILSLIEQAGKILPSMIEQFRNNQPPTEEVIILISQAYHLTPQ